MFNFKKPIGKRYKEGEDISESLFGYKFYTTGIGEGIGFYIKLGFFPVNRNGITISLLLKLEPTRNYDRMSEELIGYRFRHAFYIDVFYR